MYAVIKTGGKQYRVQPGDLLVVEKLEGDVGAEVAFDQVLMLNDGGETVVGAPVVEGAVVRATLIETRKGEKVKIFKKIRRQGYRRTRGHRQTETVLRVTGFDGAGKSASWDGTVDLTPKALLDARARNLKNEIARLEALMAPPAPVVAETAAPAKAKKAKAGPAAEATLDTVGTEADGVAVDTVAAEAAPAPKKSRAKKAQPAADAGEDA